MITVRIKDLVTTTMALVCTNLREDAILGIPWLTEENKVVEPAARIIHFSNKDSSTLDLHLDKLDHEVRENSNNKLQKILHEQLDVFGVTDPSQRTTIAEHAIPLEHNKPLFGPRS
ncbi:hypothetical protein PR048_012921 [Dryococelus australis]|uniref:Uncharacterized protein n=1 Tax=Dryococelus australis TaxID=614101 RepID=A0ABQ9HQQ5_9NEOP|nr:hypothetical protein PR048_012921 [Dryococelus australis]